MTCAICGTTHKRFTSIAVVKAHGGGYLVVVCAQCVAKAAPYLTKGGSLSEADYALLKAVA